MGTETIGRGRTKEGIGIVGVGVGGVRSTKKGPFHSTRDLLASLSHVPFGMYFFLRRRKLTGITVFARSAPLLIHTASLHFMHALEPVSSANMPASQASQTLSDAALGLLEYFPASQCLQAELPG